MKTDKSFLAYKFSGAENLTPEPVKKSLAANPSESHGLQLMGKLMEHILGEII